MAGSFYKFVGQNLPIHRLDISSSLALAMFEDNVFKSEQIPQIAAKSASGETVTVYRVGKLVVIHQDLYSHLCKRKRKHEVYFVICR